MKKFFPLLLSLALIALMGIAAHYLNKAQEVGPPPEASAPIAVPDETPEAISNPTGTGDEVKPEPVSKISKRIDQKIDASSDKAMVDSLDYISRQMDSAEQQQLQDDYSVIASILSDNVGEVGEAGDDSLAKVREAINGKTAAELSDLADSLTTKK